MAMIWRIPEDFPEEFIGSFDRNVGLDPSIFRKGLPVPSGTSAPAFFFAVPFADIVAYSSLPNDASVPLVNASLATTLKNEAGDDVQLIQAKVSATDKVSDEYFVVNVVRKVYAIDKSSSKFLMLPGANQILSFSKLRHVVGCLADGGIARDAEYLPHVLVSPALERVLKGMKVSGLDLTPVEQVFP